MLALECNLKETYIKGFVKIHGVLLGGFKGVRILNFSLFNGNSDKLSVFNCRIFFNWKMYENLENKILDNGSSWQGRTCRTVNSGTGAREGFGGLKIVLNIHFITLPFLNQSRN